MHTKYVITPEMDEQIRRLYQEKVGMDSSRDGNAPVRGLATRQGIPRWKVTRHAMNSGYIPKMAKPPNWSNEELAVLQKHAHKAPEVIRRHLKKAGYERSVTGIVLKRKRMRLPANLDGESAASLALCFGIDHQTVDRWIKKGCLKAEKRGTKRTPQQGGDMYYIKNKWIKKFIRENVSEIDFRKVDKYWLVDILTDQQLK